MQIAIECKNCGQVCGSYDPGRVDGDPDRCYPPEYVDEPGFIDEEGNDFCSEECYKSFQLEDKLGRRRF